MNKYVQSAVVVGVGLLAACATTSLYKATPEPDFHLSAIHKVLVISMSKTPATRLAVENEFVRQLRKRGADASASHDVLPFNTPLEKTPIASFAKAERYDTVLVSRLLGVKTVDPAIAGLERYDAPASTADANLSQYFQAVVASPEYADQFTLAAVTANVYSVESERKVWSATTQTLVTKDLPAHIKEYVGVVLKALYK